MARQADIQYIRYFTDGSAAPQVSPLIREDPYYVPKIRRRKKKLVHVDPVAVLGIVVSIGLLISMFVGLRQLQTAQQKTQQMEQYVSDLDQENKRLTREYHDSYDLQVIEKTAQAMGMVPADELPRVSVEMQKPVQDTQPEQKSVWQKISIFLTGLFA